MDSTVSRLFTEIPRLTYNMENLRRARPTCWDPPADGWPDRRRRVDRARGERQKDGRNLASEGLMDVSLKCKSNKCNGA